LHVIRGVTGDLSVIVSTFRCMPAFKCVWIGFAIYLTNLLVSKIILAISKFGMENASTFLVEVFLYSR